MSQTLWENFNFEGVIIKDPIKNSRGGQQAYMDTSSSNRSNPTFQLPKMRVPFGLDRNEQSQSTRYNMEVSVDNEAFYNKIRQFDEGVIDEGGKKSKLWFGKTLSASKIRDNEMYHYSCKGDPQGKYHPLMRIKVATEGKKIPKVYVLHTSEDGQQSWTKGTYRDVEKGCHVTAIVEMAGLWFMQKQFGTTYLATHLLVEKSKEEIAFPFVGIDAMQAAGTSGGSSTMEVEDGPEAYREIE